MTRGLVVQGRVSSATDPGGRQHQQDRFVVFRKHGLFEQGWLLAVMDGHGDSAEVAEFCEKYVGQYFSFSQRFEDGKSFDDDTIRYVLENVISMLHLNTREMHSGSTISLVYISETSGKATVAILGDSPVIIKGSNGIWVSPEHNIRTNMKDRDAVLQKGASFHRGYLWDTKSGSGLMLTRALGNNRLDHLLIREPEIFFFDLDEESFVIVASDGLLDPSHKDQKALDGLVRIVANDGTAHDLVNDALRRQTRDNVTALLWKQPNQLHMHMRMPARVPVLCYN